MNLTKRYTDPKIVSLRLKGLMKEKGWKQSDLAEKSMLSVSTIKQYTSGRRVPEKENLSRLAKAFQVDEDYLTGASPYRDIWDKYDAQLGERGLADLQDKLKETRKFWEQFDFSDLIISNFGGSDFMELPKEEIQQIVSDIEQFVLKTVKSHLDQHKKG